tara:strand:- start:717 stop:1448 length:732 start_codon:yes stop_codon:yes gene_type:complete
MNPIPNALIFHSFENNINSDPFYDLRLIEFKKILEFLKSQKDGRRIIITFDDGYKSIIPAVEFSLKNKFKTIIFVVTDYLDKEGFLTKKDLNYLSSKGCQVGSHTKSHANLNKLKMNLLEDELLESKQILEKIINKKVTSLSFPYGQKNKLSIKKAFQYYDLIYISRPLIFKNDSIIGRISINKSNINKYENIFYLAGDNLKIFFFLRLLIISIIKRLIPNKYYLFIKTKITGKNSTDVFNSN